MLSKRKKIRGKFFSTEGGGENVRSEKKNREYSSGKKSESVCWTIVRLRKKTVNGAREKTPINRRSRRRVILIPALD